MNRALSKVDSVLLRQLEESLWQAETRFDRDCMEKVMAPDFYEFGRSGRIHSREACLANTSGTINATIPLPNLDIRLLSADVAQVTYDSEVINDDGTVDKAHRSSIWTKDANGWQLRFHQGTAFIET